MCEGKDGRVHYWWLHICANITLSLYIAPHQLVQEGRNLASNT